MDHPVQHAAEAWKTFPELPSDPKRLCLVDTLHRHSGERRYYLLHHVRQQWAFPDRSTFSNTHDVLRWAYLNV